MSSVSNSQGAAAAAAALIPPSTAVTESPTVILSYSNYRSALNYCDFFGRTVTIVTATAGGAAVGAGVGLVTAGLPGAAIGGGIGGVVGFTTGCLLVSSWDGCQFRKWKLRQQTQCLSAGGAGIPEEARSRESSEVPILDQKIANIFGERAEDFLCPLGRCLIETPVVLRVGDASSRVFEKRALDKWISSRGTWPEREIRVTEKNVFPDLKTLAIMHKVATYVIEHRDSFGQFTDSDIEGLACHATGCKEKMDIFEKTEIARLEKELHEGRISQEVYFSHFENLAETLEPEVSV